jgi:hypothetical protein
MDSVMPTKAALLCLVLCLLPVAIHGQMSTPPASKSSASIPPDCDKPELLAKGQPVMNQRRDGLAFGFSLPKHDFKVGEPIVLYIWVDNPGDAPAGVMTCEDLGHFKGTHIGIYDASGRRVPSQLENRIQEKCAANPRIEEMMIQTCGRNFAIHIPAHTCVNRGSFDFTSVLTDNYDLPPGDYTVRLRSEASIEMGGICGPEDKAPVPPELGTAVSFSVVKP